MKLFGKMTLLTAGLALTATTASLGVLSVPVISNGSLRAATSSGTNGIELKNYTRSYKLGDTTNFTDSVSGEQAAGYLLPQVSASAANVVVTARNRVGVATTVGKDADGKYYLVANKAGIYNVTYSVTEGEKTTSTRNITIEITAEKATFNFEANSQYIIPSVAYKTEKIIFPQATVLDADGNEILGTDNKPIKVNPTSLKNGATVVNFGEDTTEGLKTYTVQASDKGDFSVIYTYSDATNKISEISQTFTFRVQSTEADVELKYGSGSDSLNTFALEVGVEATLPKFAVLNSKANDVEVTDVYTVVTVLDMTTNTETKVTNYKYTPQNAGSYRFTYNTTDAHGNTCTQSVQRDNVKLTSSSITTKVIGDYSAVADVSTIVIDDEENVDYMIPSVVYLEAGNVTSKEVTIPAMFAVGGWGTYSNLEITRSIWKENSSGSYTSSEDLENNPNLKKPDDTTYTAKDDVIYKFTKGAGNYKVRYHVRYLDTNSQGISGTDKYVEYFITVKEHQDIVETNLTVAAPVDMPTAVIINEDNKITFGKPVVSDDEDERVQVKVEYKYDLAGAEYQTLKANSDGEYELDVVKPAGISDADWQACNKVVFKFTAINDLEVSRSIEVNVAKVDYSTDVTAPNIVIAEEAAYDNANKVIKLKTVTVTNDGTDVSLVCYVTKDGKAVESFSATSGQTPSFAAMDYEPTDEGVYQFTYVATDQNYNMATLSTQCEVAFVTGYSVSIGAISTQEYGSVVDLTKYVNVTKNGQKVSFDDSKIHLVSDKTVIDQDYLDNNLDDNALLIQVTGAYKDSVGGKNGLIIALDGDITVKAWAKDVAGICDFNNNASAKITFSSADTTSPVFKIVGESEGSDVLGTYDFPEGEESVEVIVNWFDNESIEDADSDLTPKVEIFLPGKSTSSTPDFTFDEPNNANDTIKFTATQQGKFTVKYTLTDSRGNANSRVFKVAVGDVIAPEIVVAKDAIVVDNKTYTINLDKVTIENDELSKTSDLVIKATLNGENIDYTTSTDKKLITITAESAGTLAITFDITDSAGNVAKTVTKTYTVSSDKPSTVNSTTVWGTIIIIVSLIVLGGVIFFFVKPSKAKKTTSTRNTKKETK